MKEILKSKWMIGFMIMVLSVTYMSGASEKKMNESYEKQKEEVVLLQK